jgi:L-threonylcarbamoyladenylate synthase
MKTRVIQVDPQAPAPQALREAAAVLHRGGLVAFPTETVYGLGASALDAAAVARIFAAKQRPADNPLIVHVAGLAEAAPLVAELPETARRLAARFWPGPLSLVLPKSAAVPEIVTAGGPTVALRVPAHPVALALLRESGLPLAAPSANPASMLSPTTAEHVLRGLGNRIDLVLDAGPTPGGLESTVLDVTVSPPRLLRPGLVTREALEEVVGPLATRAAGADDAVARSPGQQARHYAPRVPLECVFDGNRRVLELLGQGRRVGWLTHHPAVMVADGLITERLPGDAAAYAAGLYAALHRLDALGVERIVVDLPPAGPVWSAVHDRLRRAASTAGAP